MWELVCHYTYKWNGQPIDLSFYNNLADADAAFLPDGIAPGSGALRFVQPNNRVRVFPGPAWNPLVALRIEVTARLTEPSQTSQTLIEGDDSFGLFVGTQALFFYFIGKSVYPGVNTDGVNTYKDGLKFPGYRLPYGKWANIVLVHNGLNQMLLFVNGEPVTVPRLALSGIRPVGPKGISIGNGIDGNTVFGGDIDEVKVWRLDPNAGRREFLDMPMDPAAIECWERFLKALREALAANPECAGMLASFPEAMDDWRRAIADQGPETGERFARFCERFADLWRAGQIDGPDMEALLADWCTWLRLVGLSPQANPQFAHLYQSRCWHEIARRLPGLDCDPHFMGLVRLLGQCCGGTPPAPRRQRRAPRREQRRRRTTAA